jgi:CheY-like chemotaxis protein
MDSRLTFLCVDDDTATLSLLRSTLEAEFPEATVLTRPDAESGLATLTAESVDVLVSDSVRLDSGESFVEAARNHAPTLPTVLYTGKAYSDVAVVINRAGVSEYVRKGGDGLRILLGHVERFAESAESDGADAASVGVDSTDADDTLRVVDAADAPTLDVTEWTTVTGCDPSSMDDLLAALLEVLGERVDDRPLIHVVDVELLATMFSSHRSPTPLQVRFAVDDAEVAVAADGLVAVRPLTSD